MPERPDPQARGGRLLSPVFVGGVALAIALVNLLTIRIPDGTSPIGFLVGVLGVPLLVTVVYTAWYLRRSPKG